ncbi:hypothetical protein PUN28_013044 [Cardiocondyla obscurior]|uniref:Secreted protein n=1 Tax=Cardiocondyla obscurior TaxID=286306 RepID=A0AAW2F9Q2_9HYME
MYILSRVFLFPRFISPVAVVSRDTFYHYFVFLSSRMIHSSKEYYKSLRASAMCKFCTSFPPRYMSKVLYVLCPSNKVIISH